MLPVQKELPPNRDANTIFCSECGKKIPAASAFCPMCGFSQEEDNKIIQPHINATDQPSLFELKCPQCQSKDYIALGVSGGTGKYVATQLAFGLIGQLAASSAAKKNMDVEEINYKCKQCKYKFSSLPLQAKSEELLTIPCTIQFTRISSFVGSAMLNVVNLNGIKMGALKNGQTLAFQTNIKYNILFVTDQHGVAFPDAYRFEAQPGGNVMLRFKRKFCE